MLDDVDDKGWEISQQFQAFLPGKWLKVRSLDTNFPIKLLALWFWQLTISVSIEFLTFKMKMSSVPFLCILRDLHMLSTILKT